ncbi:MAG: MotA/TolQ/ExbB proton channel family protein [Candidatus Omnitrophica bacterium]|nr:MotA/TolQ/ExbB proton channel family protein [Candidatus Omnitrophota bacterium]
MFDIIQKGGAIMYPIILCSIIAFAIILERLYYLRKMKIDAVVFMNNIEGALKYNKIAEAVKICEDTVGPIARIVKAGILKYDRPRQEMREAIEDAGHQEVPMLEKHIKILATIAHITPLLGLLGTVVGMVKAFQVIQVKTITLNPVSAGDLAGGIWEALLTTAAGLIVAIPVIAAYHYLAARVQDFALEMERSATELINILSQRIEGYK